MSSPVTSASGSVSTGPSASPSPSVPLVCAPSVSGAKFYYMTGSCASASMAVIQTLGLKGISFEQVELISHKTHTGKDYYTINPKGNVPYLVLSNGQTLNEGAAILQFLADQKPAAALAGQWGTMDRYVVQNALNHLSSEVQVALHLWGVKKEQNHADFLVEKAKKKLDYVNKQLETKKYYVLDRFTVADCYLFFLLSWIPYMAELGLQMDNYPNIKAYHQHIGSLPQIEQTLKLMAANPENSD